MDHAAFQCERTALRAQTMQRGFGLIRIKSKVQF